VQGQGGPSYANGERIPSLLQCSPPPLPSFLPEIPLEYFSFLFQPAQRRHFVPVWRIRDLERGHS
jgi:hypothetical protein